MIVQHESPKHHRCCSLSTQLWGGFGGEGITQVCGDAGVPFYILASNNGEQLKCTLIVLTFLVNFGNIRNKALLFSEHIRTFVPSFRQSCFCSRGHRKKNHKI